MVTTYQRALEAGAGNATAPVMQSYAGQRTNFSDPPVRFWWIATAEESAAS